MIARPGEEDACVWQEIGDWIKTFAEALMWFALCAVISGTLVSLLVLRYIAEP